MAIEITVILVAMVLGMMATVLGTAAIILVIAVGTLPVHICRTFRYLASMPA